MQKRDISVFLNDNALMWTGENDSKAYLLEEIILRLWVSENDDFSKRIYVDGALSKPLESRVMCPSNHFDFSVVSIRFTRESS